MGTPPPQNTSYPKQFNHFNPVPVQGMQPRMNTMNQPVYGMHRLMNNNSIQYVGTPPPPSTNYPKQFNNINSLPKSERRLQVNTRQPQWFKNPLQNNTTQQPTHILSNAPNQPLSNNPNPKESKFKSRSKDSMSLKKRSIESEEESDSSTVTTDNESGHTPTKKHTYKESKVSSEFEDSIPTKQLTEFDESESVSTDTETESESNEVIKNGDDSLEKTTTLSENDSENTVIRNGDDSEEKQSQEE